MSENGTKAEWWLKVLTDKGPLYVLFLLFVGAITWYGPSVVQGHRDMMRAVGESSQKNAETSAKQASLLENISKQVNDNHKEDIDHHRRTQEAISTIRQ